MKVPFHQVYDPKAVMPLFLERIQQMPHVPGQWRMEFQKWLAGYFGSPNCFPTSSCTHALEAIALAMDLQPGDEIIVPSYSYVTSASAFALRGATVVFADCEADTMNVNLDEVELLITKKTKAVVVMHYAGLACDMDRAKQICAENKILLIEDAAHGIGAYYKGQPLGAIGDAGTLSFHHTKNIQCGEGGALHCNDESLLEKLYTVLNKGTNRTAFDRGLVDFYTWMDLGSSNTLSDLSAAWLLSEVDFLEEITHRRREIWTQYYDEIKSIKHQSIQLPGLRDYAQHNGHIFFIKTKDKEHRNILTTRLKENGIAAYFHYIPLHLSPGGKKYGIVRRDCSVTEKEAGRLLRLPVYPGLDGVGELVDTLR